MADLSNLEQPDTIKGVRPDLSVKKKGRKTLIEIETSESVESARDEKQKKAPSNGVRKANTSTSEESSPKNKKSHKIDWDYISHINYLKATGQIPVIRFTVHVELPKRNSKRKTVGSGFQQ